MTLPYVPQVRTMTPCAMHAFATAEVSAASGSPVTGSTNSAAIMAPWPRMSPMRGSDAWISPSRPLSTASTSRARSRSPSVSNTSMAATAAAHAIGLPP